MGPKPVLPQTAELFRSRLDEQIDMRHPLVRLAGFIDWPQIESSFAAHFTSGVGRPALRPRLVAGLLYLQHTFSASDESVAQTWVENPYWQHFCGETYLQTKLPLDASSLTRWRKRIGEAGVELLLQQTIEAARRAAVIDSASAQRVIVDSTVMPKAIAHPTDSRLLVDAEVILTHPTEVNLTHLGEDGSHFGAADVDPGAGSGDPSHGPQGRERQGDREAVGLLAQHGAPVSARRGGEALRPA